MGKLKQLISKCKCGVFVSVNEHRDYYQTVEDRLADLDVNNEDLKKEVMDKMVATNTLIQIQFYPDTPIGFHTIYHYDLDAALSEALECFRDQTAGKEG